jgi:5-methylcytosine-specific restriction endonuclease McrA
MKRDTWAQVWMDIEDQLVPMLQLRPSERAVYCYLLRHTHLVGRRQVCVAIFRLARGVCLSESTTRFHLYGLARRGCVRLHGANSTGHKVEVFEPARILANRRPRLNPMAVEDPPGYVSHSMRRSRAIFRRQGRRCFYCLKDLRFTDAVFDHVVAVARGGGHGDDNVVAACDDCNIRKGTQSAAVFLREMRRTGRISESQHAERLRAVRQLRRHGTVSRIQ